MSVVLKNHFVNDNVVPQCQKFGLVYKDIKEVSTLTGFPLCRISLNKKKIGRSMRLPCLAVPLNSWHSTCWLLCTLVFLVFVECVHFVESVQPLKLSSQSGSPWERECTLRVIPGECFRAVGLDRKPQRRGWRQETWRKEGEPGQRVPGGSG